ncbi:Uncharacterised protein [Bordetella pertussis]|nr:Uncharacterised protein [Bordetella pertussis]CFW20033.1 Uncharacterised protein [Bordetella pertussis]CPJ84664.1 Uncharacterised protein [Bordetella pertussis]CPP02446.1 Uncharacterised protein [Bordetella pertussis]
MINVALAAGVRRRAFTSRIWCAYTTSSPAQASQPNCRNERRGTPCRRHSRIADTATKATTMRTAATTCTSMWNVRYFTATRLTPQAAMTSSNCRYTRPTLAGDAMAVDT